MDQPGLFLQEAADAIVGNGPQPFAKTSAPGIIFKLPDGPAHAEQYFLSDLGRIGVLQAAAARTAVDERTVDIDEGLPGFAIVGVVDPPQ